MITNVLHLVQSAAEPKPKNAAVMSLLRLEFAFENGSVSRSDLSFQSSGFNVEVYETHDDGSILFSLTRPGATEPIGYIELFSGYGALHRQQGLKKATPALVLWDATNEVKLHTFDARLVDRLLRTKHVSTREQVIQLFQALLKSMLPKAADVLEKHATAATEPEVGNPLSFMRNLRRRLIEHPVQIRIGSQVVAFSSSRLQSNGLNVFYVGSRTNPRLLASAGDHYCLFMPLTTVHIPVVEHETAPVFLLREAKLFLEHPELNRARAAVEPEPQHTDINTVYRNQMALHRAAVAVIKTGRNGSFHMNIRGVEIWLSVSFNSTIHAVLMLPTGQRDVNFSPSDFADDSLMYTVEGHHPAVQVPKRYQMNDGTPKQYLQHLVAFALEKLAPSAEAAAEPEIQKDPWDGVNTDNLLTSPVPKQKVQVDDAVVTVQSTEYQRKPAWEIRIQLPIPGPKKTATATYLVKLGYPASGSGQQSYLLMLQTSSGCRQRFDCTWAVIDRRVNTAKKLMQEVVRAAVKDFQQLRANAVSRSKYAHGAAEPQPEKFGWAQVEEYLDNTPPHEVRTKDVTLGYDPDLDDAHRVFFVTSVPGCGLGYVQDAGDGHGVRVYVNNVFRTTVRVTSLQDLLKQIDRLTKAHAKRPRT